MVLSAQGTEKRPVKKDSHVTLSRAHPHADTRTRGRVVGTVWEGAVVPLRTPRRCPARCQPLKKLRHRGLQPPGHFQGGSQSLRRVLTQHPSKLGSALCLSSNPAGQATGLPSRDTLIPACSSDATTTTEARKRLRLCPFLPREKKRLQAQLWPNAEAKH